MYYLISAKLYEIDKGTSLPFINLLCPFNVDPLQNPQFQATTDLFYRIPYLLF